MLTKLEEIKGFEEQLDHKRPSGESYSRDFKGPNWRDLLAITWQVKTVSGLPNIGSMIQSFTPDTQPYGFRIPQDHAAPRSVIRAGVEVIEAIFCLETRVGRSLGVIRLTPVTKNSDNSKLGRC